MIEYLLISNVFIAKMYHVTFREYIYKYICYRKTCAKKAYFAH